MPRTSRCRDGRCRCARSGAAREPGSRPPPARSRDGRLAPFGGARHAAAELAHDQVDDELELLAAYAARDGEEREPADRELTGEVERFGPERPDRIDREGRDPA